MDNEKNTATLIIEETEDKIEITLSEYKRLVKAETLLETIIGVQGAAESLMGYYRKSDVINKVLGIADKIFNPKAEDESEDKEDEDE